MLRERCRGERSASAYVPSLHHKREPSGGRQIRTPGAYLTGSDLLVNVRLLPDPVFQVRDVGLEPIPATDDGCSVCCPPPLRPSPPGETQKGRGDYSECDFNSTVPLQTNSSHLSAVAGTMEPPLTVPHQTADIYKSQY